MYKTKFIPMTLKAAKDGILIAGQNLFNPTKTAEVVMQQLKE
jgi:hypothetical protein